MVDGGCDERVTPPFATPITYGGLLCTRINHPKSKILHSHELLRSWNFWW